MHRECSCVETVHALSTPRSASIDRSRGKRVGLATFPCPPQRLIPGSVQKGCGRLLGGGGRPPFCSDYVVVALVPRPRAREGAALSQVPAAQCERERIRRSEASSDSLA